MKLIRVFRRSMLFQATFAILAIAVMGPVWPHSSRTSTPWMPGGFLPSPWSTNYVTVERVEDGSFRYLVNGTPQVFVGMGYNPIYRYLSDEERAANYDRDFRILREAGVNHIIGWDADKGYEQDKFDELTLDYADKYGIGVVMPFYLPPEGDYADESFTESLKEEAARKVERFRDHPALRIWGPGNEVIAEMPEGPMWGAFCRFYLELADLIHDLDPNHPVMYRAAEDAYMSAIEEGLRANEKERPWLLYGMNTYTLELERILDAWPPEGIDCPLIVTEFGAEPDSPEGRAIGYLSMWRMIRAHPEYVLGGAPYAWTTAGPEPTDVIWGLMDENSQPVDDTFEQLAEEWQKENGT